VNGSGMGGVFGDIMVLETTLDGDVEGGFFFFSWEERLFLKASF